ncbi:putative membrane protein, partial [Chlamydia psittaci 06-1683]
LKVYG